MFEDSFQLDDRGLHACNGNNVQEVNVFSPPTHNNLSAIKLNVGSAFVLFDGVVFFLGEVKMAGTNHITEDFRERLLCDHTNVCERSD